MPQVALITGGARGIGWETVKLLLKHNVKVVSVDLVEHKEPPSQTFFPIQGDITSEKNISDVLLQTINTFGTIDILVNNAGVIGQMSK